MNTDETQGDRRRDALLRNLVQQCLGSLRERGFALAQRGDSANHSWVQLQGPARDPNGYDGMLVMLIAHGRRERTVMVDAYFEDATLQTQTPQHKVLHRYAPESELPRIVREVVDQVSTWRA